MERWRATSEHPINANPDIEETTNKPDSILLYNKYIGCVDKNNQLCSYYRVGRGSHKWWRYIFWFGFNICITNGWILWNESAHVSIPNLDHFKFCVMSAEEMRAGFTSKKLNMGRPSRFTPRLIAKYARIGIELSFSYTYGIEMFWVSIGIRTKVADTDS